MTSIDMYRSSDAYRFSYLVQHKQYKPPELSTKRQERKTAVQTHRAPYNLAPESLVQQYNNTVVQGQYKAQRIGVA
eukprot:3163362-Rhodomonas_salina.1